MRRHSMRKLLLAGIVMLAATLSADAQNAQDSKKIRMLENEKWWGSVTDLGRHVIRHRPASL